MYASRLGSIATDIDVDIATAIVLILAVTVDSLVRRRGATGS